MKLSHKLSLALVTAVCTVYAVLGYVRVRQELLVLERDMERDHQRLGRGLGLAVLEVWSDDGPEEAIDLIRRVNQRDSQITFRWVWLDEDHLGAEPPLPLPPVQEFAPGQALTYLDREAGESGVLRSYFPLDVVPGRLGALEMTESLEQQESYYQQSAWRIVWVGLALATVSSLVLAGLGFLFVGRPVGLLIQQVRLVGAGDLRARIVLHQRDELGELAQEVNAMSARLLEAQTRLEVEASARLAALEQLRHADRLATVGKLAAGIAHELGTPLNVVGARARLIQQGEVLGEEILDNARIIVEQTTRMTTIIRQLMAFARPGAPSKSLQDLAELSRRCLALLQPLARKKDVELHFEAADSVVLAQVDPFQLQQVLTNVLVNAIQAMARPGRVAVRVGRAIGRPPAAPGQAPREVAVIVVEDQGEGIAPEDRARVFEPFFTTKDVGEGTGLGLAVAYGIVQEHGGWIEVESEVGRGSRFSIHLPTE